jgi:hypothetical protein
MRHDFTIAQIKDRKKPSPPKLPGFLKAHSSVEKMQQQKRKI